MQHLQVLLSKSAARHRNHLCPRQVLGARMGLYAGELLGLGLPQSDKRMFTFIETDGCLVDGVAAATGCWVGNRTMRVIDYGKSAATFVDRETEYAIRITPAPTARARARDYALDAPDRWHAQLVGYQVMPTMQFRQQMTDHQSSYILGTVTNCGFVILNGVTLAPPARAGENLLSRHGDSSQKRLRMTFQKSAVCARVKYSGGHALHHNETATADRLTWLRKELGLQP